VELIVGALVVFGLVAVAVRFFPPGEAGGIVLPRVIDDSIGMWILRRITRRRLGAARLTSLAASRYPAEQQPVAALAARLAARRRAAERGAAVARWRLRIVALAAFVVAFAVVGAVVGMATAPHMPRGQVLAATATPPAGGPGSGADRPTDDATPSSTAP
jgi:hypothetical protein